MNEKLIDKFKNGIVLNSAFIDKLWVYAIYNGLQELVYIYYGKLSDIVAMRPFKINEKFEEGRWYKYVLIEPCNNKIEAENAVNKWIKLSELEGATPPLNMYNRQYNNDKFVYCVENGRYYKTAQDVVKIFRVSQSAVSNHLRCVTGYKMVKGLHFRYDNTPNPDVIEVAGGHAMFKTALGGYKYDISNDPINNDKLTNEEVMININKMVLDYQIGQVSTYNGGNYGNINSDN